MDLEELGFAHNGAVRQINVIDTCLSDLLNRRQAAVNTDNAEHEFDYIDFKIDILTKVKLIYQEYRDQKWTQLQQESAKSLQEVLNIAVTPLTPPTSQPDHSFSMDVSTEVHEITEEDLLVHMIPIPLTPIDDTDDMMVPTFSSWRELDMDTDNAITWLGDFSRD